DMQTMIDFLERKKKATVREVVLLAVDLDFERRYQMKLKRTEDDLVVAWMCIVGRRLQAKEERKRQQELCRQRADVQRIKEALIRSEAEVLFVHRGEPSGIASTQMADGMIFLLWYGYRKKAFGNIDEMMTEPFFDGCSLEDLAGMTAFEIVEKHI
ncbi:MAG: hypothetical protein J6B02_03645, partial [Selenomonadales bacterium]|nr:hypothetical protein [Selenomonadales bacterium]